VSHGSPRADEFVNLVNDLPAAALVSTDALSVANRLRPVLLQLGRELRREVHPLGVTGGQVSLLVAIRRTPGIGVRELALRENVSAAAMSRHVTRLGKAGLVRRDEGTGGDGRRVGLELTTEGERVLRLVRSRRTAWLAARLESLDEEELDAIDGAVDALAALLEAPR
jgi:DNA-binding MarR family transcriptional regulator